MLSAPVTSDLLDPKSWSPTERVPYPPSVSEGQTWLEGNAVIAPDGFVYDILRVHNLEKAATLRVLNQDRLHFEASPRFLVAPKSSPFVSTRKPASIGLSPTPRLLITRSLLPTPPLSAMS
jgi:hypothetical protein